MTVAMVALRRFMVSGPAGTFEYQPGEQYEVPSKEWADFHVKTGRGKPVADTKPAKSEE